MPIWQVTVTLVSLGAPVAREMYGRVKKSGRVRKQRRNSTISSLRITHGMRVSPLDQRNSPNTGPSVPSMQCWELHFSSIASHATLQGNVKQMHVWHGYGYLVDLLSDFPIWRSKEQFFSWRTCHTNRMYCMHEWHTCAEKCMTAKKKKFPLLCANGH